MNKQGFLSKLYRDRVSYMMLAPYLTLFIVFTVVPVV